MPVRVQDDESLRKWKEQLLGSVDLDSVGGLFLSLSLSLCPPTPPHAHKHKNRAYLRFLLVYLTWKSKFVDMVAAKNSAVVNS